MRGFTTGKLGEPLLNPSYLNLSREKAPGWGMNGPGVSAEWTQGGESEWNSAAAAPMKRVRRSTRISRVRAAGQYALWVRYADWATKSENFTVTIAQDGAEVFRHEFGAKDVVDPHDEVSHVLGLGVHVGQREPTLKKGPARIVDSDRESRGSTPARRLFPAHERSRLQTVRQTKSRTSPPCVICAPGPRRANRFASLLRSDDRRVFRSVGATESRGTRFPDAVEHRERVLAALDKPAAERPLYPFNAEPIEEFVAKYKGARDVPLFQSKLVVPVIYINNVPEYLKEGSPFLRYLRETKVPFAILINYGARHERS